jgi:hypothetical protein
MYQPLWLSCVSIYPPRAESLFLHIWLRRRWSVVMFRHTANRCYVEGFIDLVDPRGPGLKRSA